MKIILISAFKANPYCTGHHLYSALTKIGHKVHHLCFRSSPVELNSFIKENGDEFDMLLAWKGSGIGINTLEEFKGVKVLWYPDDMTTVHAQHDIERMGHLFDYIFTPIVEDVGGLEYKYGLNAYFLPCGADLDAFREDALAEKIYDFSFVGALYPERVNILTRLSKITKSFYVGNCYGDEYIKVINQSRININCGLNFKGTQLRIFEVLAAGGFLLTNQSRYTNSVLRDGVGMFTVKNLESVFGNYLNTPEEREAKVLYSKKIIAAHTWGCRIKELIDKAGGSTNN